MLKNQTFKTMLQACLKIIQITEIIDRKFEKKNFLREGRQTKNENHMILARISYVAWLK